MNAVTGRIRFSDPKPGMRRRYVRAALVALLALAPCTGSLVTSQPPERPPRFSNSEPPAPLGRGAGEPSLGVTHTLDVPGGLLGRTMYIAGLETLRVTYDDCTSPPTPLWEDVSFTTTSLRTLDPILFTDQVTGRTFVSQLAGKTSLMAFTDDEGVNYQPSQGAGINSGVDHQTVGGGPYPAGDPGSTNEYPHAVYYCSQDAAVAQCALSRDGGITFGPAVPIYPISECGGLHGHVKVAPDGTAYVPNPSCNRGGNPLSPGEPGVVRSTDAGITWQVRTVPGALTSGSSDPAVGIATDGRLYLGYEDRGRASVAVSQNRGDTWLYTRDVSTAAGLEHSLFPQMTAGDPNRAAISFLGTDYAGPGDPEGQDATLPAAWYQYVAVTYDGGDTWVTVNATPGDPVQRGTICGLGTTCTATRNLLDFNDITHDVQGRIMAAYADGCIGGCVNGPPNSGTDVAKIARQVSGKGLFAAFDPDGTEPPAAVRLRAVLTEGSPRVDLSWEEPDDRGRDIDSYNVYRRRTDLPSQPQIFLASVGADERSYADTTLIEGETYDYEVTAVSLNGEGARCREVTPIIVPPRMACIPPGDLAVADPEGDQLTTAALDIVSLRVAEPAQTDRASRLVFTLKVADLTTFSPGNAWVILWNRPIPDAEFDRNFVAMRATGPASASFTYGKVTPPNANQGVDLGTADDGSFSPDGTIVISIATDRVDGVASGQDLTGLEVRTFPSNVSNQPITQLSADDFSAAGFYNLVGNASCDPRPFAVDDSASTPEDQPVTIAILANDIDGDGDPLDVTALTDPANGSVLDNGDGTVTYTPDPGFAGTDLFDYTVSDPGGAFDDGSVRVIVFRAPPFQEAILDDPEPDQGPGPVDRDGNFTLSWTFPPLPDKQPCGFRVEEATSFAPTFSDDAEDPLVAGQNAIWSSEEGWVSASHPDTGTLGYSVTYLDEQDLRLTMTAPLALPPGPTTAALSFDSFENIEEGFDYAFVEVSVDGGPFAVLASYTGDFFGRRVVDLSAYAGLPIQIRFHFTSDQLLSAPAYLGWFIDNIEIATADFVLIGTTGGGALTFDVVDRLDGVYRYRVAGLFGSSCTEIGPYSNMRDMLVTLSEACAFSFDGIRSVTTPSEAGCTLDLAWDPVLGDCAPPSIRYNVYRSTNPSFTPSTGNAIALGASGLSYRDQDELSPGTTYHYIVRAENLLLPGAGPGGGVEEDNLVRLGASPIGTLQPAADFADDLEPGAEPGYGTFSTRATGGWEVTTDATANSASQAWVALDDQPGTPPSIQKNDTLTLPVLNLSSTSVLSFHHNFDFARFPTDPEVSRYQSGGVLEISADGATWKDLGPYVTTGGYNGVVDATAPNPLAGKMGWVGSTDGDLNAGRTDPMIPVEVDLGAAIAAEFAATELPGARIRFRLGGTFQILLGGIQGSGWGVDDLLVTGLLEAGACQTVSIPAAGRVPETLVVTHAAGGEITLTWGDSCSTGDVDFEVYEGALNSFYSHQSMFCSTGGATSVTFAPSAGSTYYLVVPANALREGSYGRRSNGVERPQGESACLPREVATTCP